MGKKRKFKKLKFKYNDAGRIQTYLYGNCATIAISILLDKDYDVVREDLCTMNHITGKGFTNDGVNTSVMATYLEPYDYKYVEFTQTILEEEVYNIYGDCLIIMKYPDGDHHTMAIKDGKIQGLQDYRKHTKYEVIEAFIKE